MITSTERVKKAIKGESVDRTPIYGWVSANLSEQINAAFDSVAAFEDKYCFDAAHIFGGPGAFNGVEMQKVRDAGIELTPDIMLDIPLLSANNSESYVNISSGIAHHKERGRFCYVQTPGFFETYNGAFGIENQLCYLALYKDELAELYKRQAKWNSEFAANCIDLGADLIHISDDWGAQNTLMFSPALWREIIMPNMQYVIDSVKKRNGLVGLHSDGNVIPVIDELCILGLDWFHPWQESAGMPYDVYFEKCQDKFAILGGICIQTTLGFNNYDRLESEIRRVFNLLKNKRWILCTTHFVQNHCTIDELVFAYDLIYKLART